MDTMVFDNIDLTKKYKFTLVLTKKNKKPITILSEAYDKSLERNLETLDKLSFSIPKYITDEFAHQKIDNPNYDKVIEENMVLLKCGEASNPIFQSYFIIKNITESLDKLSKHVECSSREVMLNKNTITMNGIERQLVKDSVNISDGIFDILTQDSTWSLGYIDENARIEHINSGTNNKYRWFDSFSKPWYTFLKDDVASAFNVILQFDTINKKINVYDKDNFGKHNGIILSENNYVKNLNKKTNSEGIVTKLIATGRDGLIFDDVNILGTDYILDYSFFKNNGQMSDELVNALNNYDLVLTQKNTEFQNVRSQIDNLDSQLVTKNSEMTKLNEELKGLKGMQRACIDSNDNTHLPQATQDVNNKVSQIGQKQNEIKNLQSQKDTLNAQLLTIANDIDKKNVKYSGQFIFNTDLLDELEEFTYTESWESNYYDNPTLLLNEAKKVLSDWCVPPTEYEIDVVDLFACAETQMYWDRINLGDFIRVYSKRLNANVDVRIVSYTYNIDSNDLKFTVSNKNKKNDDARNIGSIQRKNSEASKIVNVKKLEWNNVKDVKDAVDLFLNNNLDLARQNVVSKLGRNKIDISENGIFVMDADNENHQVAILSGLIAFTSDGWQTANTAIDSNGVYARYLVGQITITKDLYVINEAGNFSITKDGFVLKNEQFKTLISPKGVISSDNVSFLDSCDSSNPLVMDIYIDDNINIIDKVLLKLSVLDYRAYSKNAASGGAVSTTSASGGGTSVTSESAGTHRHKLFQNLQESSSTDNFTKFYGFNFSKDPNSLVSDELYIPLISTGSPLTYDIYSYEASGNHSHTVTIGSHAHNFSIPNHAHDLVYGIYSRTKVLGNMNIIVDGVTRTAVTSEKNIIDLTSYITTKGWHQILVTTPDLNRLSASLYIRSYIGA